MQWHWGNIGSAVAGASALTIAIAALIRSPAALRAWIDRQRAQAEAAREQAETARLERRRGLSGWSEHGISTWGVTLVTDEEELISGARSLVDGHPSEYVVLRVSEGSNNYNRANDLRHLIKHQALISRPPSTGELEAVVTGLEAMGILHAAVGRRRTEDRQPPLQNHDDGPGSEQEAPLG